jgi:hypothetical protein
MSLSPPRSRRQPKASHHFQSGDDQRLGGNGDEVCALPSSAHSSAKSLPRRAFGESVAGESAAAERDYTLVGYY